MIWNQGAKTCKRTLKQVDFPLKGVKDRYSSGTVSTNAEVTGNCVTACSFLGTGYFLQVIFSTFYYKQQDTK